MKSSFISGHIIAFLGAAIVGISISGATTTLTSTGTWNITSPTNNGEVVASGQATFNGVTIGRGVGSNSSNVAVGPNTISAVNTGTYLTALGSSALRYNTSGTGNSAVGFSSLSQNTTGSQNSALGQGAMYVSTTGSSNSAYGFSTLSANTSGDYNTAVGTNALYKNVTGDGNVAVGMDAGAFWADGTTSLTDAVDSIYIGTGARGKDNNDDNSIVIGTDGIGEGPNTTVIGNSSTVQTHLYGTVILDAPQGDISMGNFE